jgi:hypothetical protein
MPIPNLQITGLSTSPSLQVDYQIRAHLHGDGRWVFFLGVMFILALYQFLLHLYLYNYVINYRIVHVLEGFIK